MTRKAKRRRRDGLPKGAHRIRLEVRRILPVMRGKYGPRGAWAVVEDGSLGWIRHLKREAVALAVRWSRMQARNGRFVSLVIRKRDGRFQEERTYPRASDPRRSKG